MQRKALETAYKIKKYKILKFCIFLQKTVTRVTVKNEVAK
jgi:hypothetical protein